MSTVDVKVPLRHFITKSSYEGAWNKEVNMMDGFGTYNYPDGSEYRGRFHHGKFHGFGHLRLAQPYRFTIKGVFDHGKLVSIEDMWFPDGLHVQGQFAGNDFDSSDWDYLTSKDRRYQAERRYNQPPVGPTAYVTSSLKSRHVPRDCYDAEEGIYNPKTGWLLDRPPPFTSSIYVGSPSDKDWILRHCRHARADQIFEPIPYFCRRILANNLQMEKSQLPKTDVYAPNFRLERKGYHKLCKENGKSKPGQWTSCSDVQRVDSVGASSCLSDSFPLEPLPLDLKEIYDTATVMMNKKTATDNFHVVQSNMIRRSSFMERSRSRFDL